MENRNYKSELLGVVYEEALANFEVGAISEDRLKHYERECLIPTVPRVSTQKPSMAARSGAPVCARGK